jgi:transcription antitermination factor NusG
MTAWLVARVMTSLEPKITDRLARLQTESYWPKFCDSIIDKRSHRKRKIIRPLYPCYLFVKTVSFYFLFDIEGVTGIVLCGESPARSDRLDREINKMRDSESNGYVPAPIVELAPRLIIGSKVVILSGVLRGHVGVCQERRGSKAKVVTSLFGGDTPVWHSEADLAVA